PDRWFDYYYEFDVNNAGVTMDALWSNSAGGLKNHFKNDVHVELGLKATASRTPTGWSARLVVPRTQLIPPGPALVRFNARRLRYVTGDKKQRIAEFYNWAPLLPNRDHQPE